MKKKWIEISRRNTNVDGRVADLLAADLYLQTGTYKLKFITKKYFDFLDVQTFYPFVEIVFEVTGDEHYHVPLLLNPFGYSTYPGIVSNC